MKEVKFNQEKNGLLKLQRGINFDDIAELIKNNKQVKTIEHPNKKRYPKQFIRVKNIQRNY